MRRHLREGRPAHPARGRLRAGVHAHLRHVHPAAREGYDRAVGAYARARPSYPEAAVDQLLAELGAPARIVEIGAGTGKLTAQLVARGLRVLAVEPVAAMRARLGELGPLVTPVDAAAEALPFEAGSTGCALAAQSLHWTDVPAALAELDRVLRPGAGIGLIWNFRDVAVPWQRDLDALLGHLRGDVPHSRDGRWQRAVEASAFEVAASQTRRWSLPTDDRGVVERVRSVSYVAALPEEAQRRVDERVLRVLRRHGLRPGEVEFPYVTETYVLRRRPGGST